MVAVNVKYFYRVMRARTYLSAHYPDLSEYSIPAGAIFLSTESAARSAAEKEHAEPAEILSAAESSGMSETMRPSLSGPRPKLVEELWRQHGSTWFPSEECYPAAVRVSLATEPSKAPPTIFRPFEREAAVPPRPVPAGFEDSPTLCT